MRSNLCGVWCKGAHTCLNTVLVGVPPNFSSSPFFSSTTANPDPFLSTLQPFTRVPNLERSFRVTVGGAAVGVAPAVMAGLDTVSLAWLRLMDWSMESRMWQSGEEKGEGREV